MILNALKSVFAEYYEKCHSILPSQLADLLFYSSLLGGSILLITLLYLVYSAVAKFITNKEKQVLIDLGYSSVIRHQPGEKDKNGRDIGGREKKTLHASTKWRSNPRRLVLTNVSTSKKFLDMQNDLEALGRVFHPEKRPFLSVQRTTESVLYFWRRTAFEFIAEELPEKLLPNRCPLLGSWSIWLGQVEHTGQQLTIDLSKSPTVFFGGPQGSGKTLFLRACIWSAMNSVSSEATFILIDTKVADLIDLVDEFRGETFNPTDIQQFRSAVERLEGIQKRYIEFQKELTEKRIQIESYEQLRSVPELRSKVPPRYLIVLDEILQYVKDQPADSENKQAKDLRRRLIDVINKLGETQRNAGTALIVASQSSRQEDHPYFSFLNFQTRVSGRCNPTQSAVLFNNNSLIGTRVDLSRGKVAAVTTNVEPCVLRIPFISSKRMTDEQLIAAFETINQEENHVQS